MAILKEDMERKIRNLSGAVLGSIYMPAMGCATLALARFYIFGIVLLLVFAEAGRRIGTFMEWRSWPRISKITALLSPVLFLGTAAASRSYTSVWYGVSMIAIYGVLASASSCLIQKKFPATKRSVP